MRAFMTRIAQSWPTTNSGMPGMRRRATSGSLPPRTVATTMTAATTAPRPAVAASQQSGAGPQVRVVGEPGDDVGAVIGQGVGAGGATNAGNPLAGQVGAHRLAVTPEMAGDGRDGPPPFGQSICFHVFSH
jgi:hypothetical protein